MAFTDSDRRSDFIGEGVGNPGSAIYDASRERCKAYDRDSDLVHEIENAPVGMSAESLHKLVSEIVDNACKFSLPGTPVEVRSTTRENQYVISVTDHGRGMDPSEVSSIGAYAQFQRNLFEQQGVGLGLAIARRLIELHHGTLSILSTPGKGTTVEFSLPVTSH